MSEREKATRQNFLFPFFSVFLPPREKEEVRRRGRGGGDRVEVAWSSFLFHSFFEKCGEKHFLSFSVLYLLPLLHLQLLVRCSWRPDAETLWAISHTLFLKRTYSSGWIAKCFQTWPHTWSPSKKNGDSSENLDHLAWLRAFFMSRHHRGLSQVWSEYFCKTPENQCGKKYVLEVTLVRNINERAFSPKNQYGKYPLRSK